jgi:protein-S-isoprenylcysteine O-methyltransferase Ste14
MVLQIDIPALLFDITSASLLLLSAANILLHIWLDWSKIKKGGSIREAQSEFSTPTGPLIAGSLSTLLSFSLVAILIFSFVSGAGIEFLRTFLLYVFFQNELLWIAGFLLTSLGIILHAWSRLARQEMATSWAMTNQHKLVTNGPYSSIRHPSYSAYMMCFLGLFLLVPSPVTLLLIPGIWGYYLIAQTEETMLLKHFGEEYEEYREHTGMFIPRIR